jgi:hypothetical protein
MIAGLPVAYPPDRQAAAGTLGIETTRLDPRSRVPRRPNRTVATAIFVADLDGRSDYLETGRLREHRP